MERRVGLYRHRRASDSFSLFFSWWTAATNPRPRFSSPPSPPPCLLSSVWFRNFFCTNTPPPSSIWYSLPPNVTPFLKPRRQSQEIFPRHHELFIHLITLPPPPIRHFHRLLCDFWCRHPSDSPPFLLLPLRLLWEPSAGWERTDKRRISAVPCICSRDTAHMSRASCAQLSG